MLRLTEFESFPAKCGRIILPWSPVTSKLVGAREDPNARP